MLIQDLAHLKIVNLACGDKHSAVVSERGELFIFGKGVWGDFWEPHKIENLKIPIEEVALGNSFGACIDDEGHIYAWGEGESG